MINNDIAVFNSITYTLSKELKEQNISPYSSTGLLSPWLMSFSFLVDMHYNYINDEQLFESDFLISQDSGSILHKEISECFLINNIRHVNNSKDIFVFKEIKDDNIPLLLELMPGEKLKNIQDIVHGLVNSLSHQDNPISLGTLIHSHGEFYDCINYKQNSTTIIRPSEFFSNVKSYYINKRIKKERKIDGNVIPFKPK